MPTPNLNLPLIDRNMFADVPRDMNALAYAVDDAVGPNGKIALRQDLQSLQQILIDHINDTTKHPTPVERAGWNKAVVDIGNKDVLLTQNKGNLVLAINELFQSSSDVKTNVAAAITDKGVPTSPTATGAQMAANIRAIQTGIKGTYPIPSLAHLQEFQFWIEDIPFEPMFAFAESGGSVYYNGGGHGGGSINGYGTGLECFGYNKQQQTSNGKWRLRFTMRNNSNLGVPSNASNMGYYIAP